MTAENRRTLIALVRKVVVAGLVLLVAWLALLGLRGTIPAATINQINTELSNQSQTSQAAPLSLNPRSWDWSRSISTGKPVAQTIDEGLGPTLGLVGAAILLSLLLALLILFVGMLIGRATNSPAGVAKTRSVLRLLIISVAVSTPFFFWQWILIVHATVWWHLPAGSGFIQWTSAITAALLPAWLLVQYGHGEVAKWRGDGGPFDGMLWRHLTVNLLIRVLRLTGAIIVLSMFVELGAPFVGLARPFVTSVMTRDFPLIFGIAWVLAVVVVAAKLIADLIEIGYGHFSRRSEDEATVADEPSRHLGLPKWWLYVSLGLVAVSIVVAVAAPLIAPYSFNQMSLGARLSPPSAQHILGTDNLGRDVFSRVILGVREDVFLGLIVAGIVLVVATGLAMLAARVRRNGAWQGDIFEALVMLPRDVLCAFPWLVLILLISSLAMPMAASGSRIVFLLVLTVSLVLLPRGAGMVQEAYSSLHGRKQWLQAISRSVPVVFLLAVAGAILYVGAATYGAWGLMVPPPTPELGGMLSGPARQYMLQAPWMAQWPVTVLVLLLLVWMMAGDALLERLGFKSKAMWSKVWE